MSLLSNPTFLLPILDNRLLGIFIVKLHRDGAAFKDGRLRVGDKILSINGVALDGLRHEEVGQ